MNSTMPGHGHATRTLGLRMLMGKLQKVRQCQAALTVKLSNLLSERERLTMLAPTI